MPCTSTSTSPRRRTSTVGRIINSLLRLVRVSAAVLHEGYPPGPVGCADRKWLGNSVLHDGQVRPLWFSGKSFLRQSVQRKWMHGSWLRLSWGFTIFKHTEHSILVLTPILSKRAMKPVVQTWSLTGGIEMPPGELLKSSHGTHGCWFSVPRYIEFGSPFMNSRWQRKKVSFFPVLCT